MERRKLSDILIEIAMQGLKSQQYTHSEVMHPLMLLASVAWNREVREPCFMQDQLAGIMSRFDISKETLYAALVAQDWDAILDRMREYKRARFPDDSRFITLCGYTPWGTLRVEFE